MTASATTTSASGEGILRRLVRAPESGIVLVIIALMVALTILGGSKTKRVPGAAPGEWTLVQVNKFLDAENLVLVAKDASFIAIMAVGMTAVIVLGGIDLSVGSIYALAALAGATALRALQAQWDSGAPLWASAGVGVGVVFVVTRGQSITGIPASFSAGLFKASWVGVYPVPMLVMLGVALAGHAVLTRLVLGRRVFAIGGNETAAAYAGVRVGAVKVIVFALCGLLAGISAAVYLGYYAAFEPNAGNGYELSVIAATVIGGASLSGGRGSALGAVLGALLIQLITNAMIILNIDSSYTSIVMGAAIVAAVVLDQTKSRLSARAARSAR